ncbi:ABC1 family-domain containing protein [Nitzschia inconspicua]|uniref:ABC1 family-domain containing protein n=1 Tax=Nitzschia inconspicua TaxID=303405 RepID=A0A9K3KD07_9STRA|nr:ABC1 family-domain containing protein [Nitzschia inconspicua]
MSSTNSWLKVAAGARLVASAFVQKSTSDAATAAQRIAHHGGDLSSKASHAASILPSAEIVSVFYEQAMTLYQQSRIQEHDDVTTTTTTVKAGTAPYESQLRRKRERSQPNDVQQQQQKVVPTDSQSSSSNVDEYSAYLFHSKNNKIERSVTSEFERDSMGAFSSTLEASASSSIASQPQILPNATTDNDDTMNPRRHLEEGQAVPSTRIGRAFGFAKLGAGLLWGTAGEWTSRLVQGSSNSSSSAITTDANADRLAATLCRMRGAALKMGQMLSIQDESLLPPALTRALQQVRQGAEAMPQYQLHKQLSSQLGSDWRAKFHTFEERPFAAASIGQVHYATVRDQTTGQVRPVVVKVQYPGVALSIESDLGNLAMLVKMTGLAPKGLFIENVIRVGRDELKVECNYLNELANQESFQTLVEADPILRDNKFVVPNVFEDLTTEQILTTAYARGGTIDKVSHLDQDERNRIGRIILYLTMQELFEWRLMQTDPNWGNFLYDAETRTTTLIDFGATREFPKSFVDGYLRIVWASANRDEAVLMAQSHKMNFLTGEENETMLNAHKLSGFTVGEPFWRDEPFDFRGSQISSRMSEHTSVFLRHRLTPPPEEVYTLHQLSYEDERPKRHLFSPILHPFSVRTITQNPANSHPIAPAAVFTATF